MVNKILLFSVFAVLAFSFGFVSATTGSTSVNFFTGAGAYLCERTVSDAYWLNTTNNERIFISNTTYSAKGLCNDTKYSADFCCPKDYACTSGECKPTNLEYFGDFCNALLNNQSCNTAPASFAVSTINSFGGNFVGICGAGSSFVGFSPDGLIFCSNVTSCSCVWASGKCTANVTKQTICSDGTTFISSSCAWSEEPSQKQNLCDEQGKIVVSYSASGYTEGVACEAQTVEYPCSVSVQLPFFDKFSFIFAVLAIACIYALMRRESK
jgi:hypothetical protein